jgi:hypothetical protein
METYRHLIYRYSTGQGPIVNVGLPKHSTDYASFKLKPLRYKLDKDNVYVDLKREADRVSMQVEAAGQVIKVMGFNKKANVEFRELKARLELLKHLMLNYPIKTIKRADLDRLYEMYQQNHPGMDTLINKAIKESNGATKGYADTALKVRKGYPVVDAQGKLLAPADKKKFAEGLAGFGSADEVNWKLVLIAGLSTLALLKFKGVL